MMNWSDEKQARFDQLRQRELAGTLSAADQQELEALTAILTQAADDALLPAITRLQRERVELEARLQQRQHENEELAKLLQQRVNFAALLQRLGKASEATIDEILAKRPVVDPEPDLHPETIEKLKRLIANQQTAAA